MLGLRRLQWSQRICAVSSPQKPRAPLLLAAPPPILILLLEQQQRAPDGTYFTSTLENKHVIGELVLGDSQSGQDPCHGDGGCACNRVDWDKPLATGSHPQDPWQSSPHLEPGMEQATFPRPYRGQPCRHAGCRATLFCMILFSMHSFANNC